MPVCPSGRRVFEDDVAVFPVTVTGGQPVVIGTVGFEGVARLPLEEVRKAAAIAEETPADTAVVDLARSRVVALYRREGFASVTVTSGRR